MDSVCGQAQATTSAANADGRGLGWASCFKNAPALPNRQTGGPRSGIERPNEGPGWSGRGRGRDVERGWKRREKKQAARKTKRCNEAYRRNETRRGGGEYAEKRRRRRRKEGEFRERMDECEEEEEVVVRRGEEWCGCKGSHPALLTQGYHYDHHLQPAARTAERQPAAKSRYGALTPDCCKSSSPLRYCVSTKTRYNPGQPSKPRATLGTAGAGAGATRLGGPWGRPWGRPRWRQCHGRP